MGRGRSFVEKREDDKEFPRVQPIPKAMRRSWGEGTIVIPRCREVDALMRQVRKGQLITINQLRAAVARHHGATIGCPIAVGIMARICAGAAGEEEQLGKKRVTPFWRTLKSNGELNDKYPGGLARQRRELEREGHRIVPLAEGRRLAVADYERKLATLT